ncbi:MAG: hypothetical protein E6772_12915 [Dysgonomonas sp.]|nr:hypothetical protein [Dysgonomonas sp.]
METKNDVYSAIGDDTLFTIEVEDTLNTSRAIRLGGHSNVCLKLGTHLIKKIVYGDTIFLDDAYIQLSEKKLFGITNYQRFDDIVILPFIEGYVTEDISVKEFMYLSEQIRQSGLMPKFTLFDLFDRYDYTPDSNLYAPVLKDINHVAHGDLAYINIVRTEDGIVPIDWEYFCYASKYWDLACFLASLYVFEHANSKEIMLKTEEVADPAMAALSVMLLCEYWVAWGAFTKHDFFPKELTELRDDLYVELNLR